MNRCARDDSTAVFLNLINIDFDKNHGELHMPNTFEFLYWGQAVPEPAGHCALRITNEPTNEIKVFSFWPIFSRADDVAGSSPGFINENPELDYFIAGMRKRAYEFLSHQGLRLPSGILFYKIIFERFNEIKDLSKQDIFNIFEEQVQQYDRSNKLLGDQRKTIFDAAYQLIVFLKTTTAVDIIAAGQPDEIHDVSSLDAMAMQDRLEVFKRRNQEHTLNWYSRAGAKTDETIERGKSLYLLSCLLGPLTKIGLRRPEEIRFNCSGPVLSILQAGGIDARLAGFDELPNSVMTVKEMSRLNDRSLGKPTPDTSEGCNVINCIVPFVSWLMSCACYGKNSFANYVASTPLVVREMVQHMNQGKKSPTMYQAG